MTEDEEVSYKHSLNYMYLYLLIAAFKLPLINIRAQLLISCACRFFFGLFNPGRREIENLIVQCKDFNFRCYNELGLLMIHLSCLSL